MTGLSRTDVVVAGGGLAGLIAAAAFADAGLSVVVADPAPPPADGAGDEDRRTTAFLEPARALLDRIGLWDDLAQTAVPLRALRIADTSGSPPAVQETRIFEPGDLGASVFGWNLANAATRRYLARALAERGAVDLRWGTSVDGILTRTTEARIVLSDGTRIAARLLVAADGRDSPVRAALGIGTRTWRYGQRAFAFTATHEEPHEGVSTEVYHQGGALTTVPLGDRGGRPCSAIVWMNDGPRADALVALDTGAFDDALTERAAALLGRMWRDSPMAVWPVITRMADRLTAERTVLIAEAAHVLPPIGAQGLNTSLQDVATLHKLAVEAPSAIGTAAMLHRYESRRAVDIAARARVIDAYNRLCQSGVPALQALRRTGLRLLHGAAPLRQTVMRAGMGTR